MNHITAWEGRNSFNLHRLRIICTCGEIFDSGQFHSASTEFALHLKDIYQKTRLGQS